MTDSPVRPAVRFKVLMRDSFTCQYCGRKAPEVALQMDHLTPLAYGGSSHHMNLVTACAECNSGKGDRPLLPGCPVQLGRDISESVHAALRNTIEDVVEAAISRSFGWQETKAIGA